jgi:8-oxo-dGTP pyrophosphatase MutT (NUDIX family)
MNTKIFGTILYYLAWPLIWFYGPLNIRVRVIIKCKSEIIMVKNWFGPNSLQLPGGGKKFNEKPTDTAVREIKEELGIDISGGGRLINDEVAVVRSNGILFRYFYVQIDLPNKPSITASNEISTYEWVKIDSSNIPKQVQSYL